MIKSWGRSEAVLSKRAYGVGHRDFGGFALQLSYREACSVFWCSSHSAATSSQMPWLGRLVEARILEDCGTWQCQVWITTPIGQDQIDRAMFRSFAVPMSRQDGSFCVYEQKEEKDRGLATSTWVGSDVHLAIY